MKAWTRTFAMLLLLAFLIAPFQCFTQCQASRGVPACHQQHRSPGYPSQSCLQQHLPAVLDRAELTPIVSISLPVARVSAIFFFLVPEITVESALVQPSPPLLTRANSVLRI